MDKKKLIVLQKYANFFKNLCTPIFQRKVKFFATLQQPLISEKKKCLPHKLWFRRDLGPNLRRL